MHVLTGILKTIGLSATLMIMAAPRANAQAGSTPPRGANQVRYRVVSIPTFGGPNGHTGILGGHLLNNSGTLASWADTTQPDPFSPDGCFDGEDCFTAHAFSWQNGEITDLGVLPGGASSDTSWISPNGMISGESQNGFIDPLTGGWTLHGVLWKQGKMIDLGTLDGGGLSLSAAVNSSGEVVGLSLNAIQDPYSVFGFYQTRAYRWKNGVMQDLGTLGGPDALAVRINERGQIAGTSYLNFDPSPACQLFTGGFQLTTGAFLWENGKMIDLGTLGGTCTTVSDLNNRGQVVGTSLLAGEQAQHAFLWSNGKLTDLGITGGNFAGPLSVNDAADVVGWQTLPGDLIFHATLWTDGQIVDLGALNQDGCSLANNVNLQGQVVGISGNCFFEEPTLRAVISEKGQPVVDLNILIPPNSGVELRNATMINDRGEIVAIGWFPDGDHAPVLLIPCNQGENGDGCQNAIVHAHPSPHHAAGNKRSAPRSFLSLPPSVRNRLANGAPSLK